MAVTARTVARHELVGLEATVREATNPDLAETSGRVVSETTNTLVLAEGDRERTVPKDVAQFAFTLPDDTTVVVDGAKLVARPARRTEMRGDSTWR
jgi:ribonuclease P protein subunit POP4